MDLGALALGNHRTRSATARPGGNQPDVAEAAAEDDGSARVLELLLKQLPSYEASWPDDIKRHWFGAYYELVLRARR